MAWLAIVPAAIAFFIIGWFGGRRQAPAVAPAPPPVAPVSAAVDITSLPPIEQASQLFNVVMTADEAGDAEAVKFHGPIALRAYELVGPLNLDGHYHVGLIHAAMGDREDALARVDSLTAQVPDHLFASMLRAVMADTEAERNEIHAEFLRNYEAEIAAARPEYLEHSRSIEAFRAQVVTR